MTHTEILEVEVSAAPRRLWKAIKDLHNLAPQLLPELFQSFVYLKGSGEVGSVREIKIKNPLTGAILTNQEVVDVVDEENHKLVYHVGEGDYKKIYSVYNLTATVLPGTDAGNSKVQFIIEWEAVGEIPPAVNEERKKGFYTVAKAVEGFLVANEAEYS